MTRPLVALMRLKPGCPSLNGLEQCFRRSFSLSSGLYGVVRRRWEAEESRKLVELWQKGLSVTQICEELRDRDVPSVTSQIRVLKRGRVEPSSYKPWTAEEDSILLAQRQAGCRAQDMVLPGRSMKACYSRWALIRNLESIEELHDANPRKEFTHAELQRIIDLRVIERKSTADIGKELGRTEKSIRNVWWRRCKHMVPQEMLREIQPNKDWTSKEVDLLVTLCNKGTRMREIKAHFPDRTTQALSMRLYVCRQLLSKKQANTSPAQMERLKRELEPYVGGARLKNADIQRIREQLPLSVRTITGALYRMRRGKTDPRRPPLDEVVAEGAIASSTSFGRAFASPALKERLRRKLEPYVGARLKKADIQRIREQLPMSDSAIISTLYRMRRGVADPQRVPLDDVAFKKEIASRASFG
jgi:hypothetical protein